MTSQQNILRIRYKVQFVQSLEVSFCFVFLAIPFIRFDTVLQNLILP